MATSTGQRVGIWVIAVTLVVGTLLGFIAMMIAPENEAKDQAKQQDDYCQQIRKTQEQMAASKKALEGYENTAFDATAVKELTVETLKDGEGEVLTPETTIKANYFGWTSDGRIFDSTNTDGTVTPIPFALNEVIQGWTKGLTGAKVGSVVKLTIPAEQAYSSKDNCDGRPIGPLQFIVDVKEKV